jgi:poly-gamma-glutamate synthesis protein (capsule biosynthesis protein)
MKWVLVIIVLGIILFLGSSFFTEPESVEVKPQQPQQSEEESISVILVGDIMLDRGVEYVIKTQGRPTSGGYPDFKFPFLKIADDLNGADILFGNLEGPISDKGTKVGSIYSFRNDPKTIEGLTYAGFSVISLANNHAFDYGREALEDTLLRLKNAGIDYVGAGFNEEEAYSPIVKDYNPPTTSSHSPKGERAPINGLRIAFLAYTNLGPETWKATEKNSGIAWISENDFEKIREDIKKAKSKSDVLIVSLHSGEEYSSSPTQFQINFAEMAIDAGADIVIGHHPHVIQKFEKYKEGYVFYSLGNFVFDQSFSEETMEGQMIKILIENGKIKEILPINIKINNFFQPQLIGQ